MENSLHPRPRGELGEDRNSPSLRLFLNSHFDDSSALKSVAVSHEESVPSNLPCVSVDFADVRARVLSTQSILTSLKSTVVRMVKVMLDDKKLLQSFEAGDQKGGEVVEGEHAKLGKLRGSMQSSVMCSALKSVAVSHEESVPSNLPCVSVDFADVRARVLSTQSILTSLKSTVVRMVKVMLDDKKLLQSFEAGDQKGGEVVEGEHAKLGKLRGSMQSSVMCSALKSVAVSHEESVPSNLPCVSVDFADVRARVLSTQSILTSLKSTVVRMVKVMLDDKKLLQSFEAGDVGSDSAPAR
nr:hypothetical protein Itr_chr03CG09410 [Ipomoea trifida]